jgi:hypothetical protein
VLPVVHSESEAKSEIEYRREFSGVSHPGPMQFPSSRRNETKRLLGLQFSYGDRNTWSELRGEWHGPLLLAVACADLTSAIALSLLRGGEGFSPPRATQIGMNPRLRAHKSRRVWRC